MLIPLIKKDLTIVKGYTLGVIAIAFGLPLLLAWRQPQMGGMISLLMSVLISSVGTADEKLDLCKEGNRCTLMKNGLER